MVVDDPDESDTDTLNCSIIDLSEVFEKSLFDSQPVPVEIIEEQHASYPQSSDDESGNLSDVTLCSSSSDSESMNQSPDLFAHTDSD